jgi:cytochrome bd-type quinol oxidase subunit 2
MYNWWVFIHIVGVVGFVLAHGASTGMALRVRRERSPERLRALLELSASTTLAFYLASFLLLLGGIAAGIDGHWFSQQAWISVAFGVFVAEMVFMWAVTKPYYRRVRQVMLIEQGGGTAVGPREIEQLVDSPLPVVTFWVGTVGLIFIVYLMILQPF